MPSSSEWQQDVDNKRRVQTVPGAPEEEDERLALQNDSKMCTMYDPSLGDENFICTKTCMNFSTS